MRPPFTMSKEAAEPNKAGGLSEIHSHLFAMGPKQRTSRRPAIEIMQPSARAANGVDLAKPPREFG